MKLYATIKGLKLENGKLKEVSKGQGSNQSLSIEILGDGLQGIPTRANIYRLSLNVGNNNELQADLLDYSTGERTELTKGEKEKDETIECQACHKMIPIRRNADDTIIFENCPSCDN